jgi:hypothetical protein
VSLGQSHVGGREVGIGIDGLLKILGGSSFLFVTEASALSVQVKIALEVCIQSLDDSREKQSGVCHEELEDKEKKCGPFLVVFARY